MPDVLDRPVNYVVPPSERQPIVTDWTGPDDYVNAPPSYDAFYRQYRSYTYFLVLKFGVRPSDLDDVVNDIIVRFWERDSIGVFRREWKTRSATKKSNFRSYYSRFVVTYARGKNRNVYRHGARSPLICDGPSYVDENKTWIEVFGPTVEFEDALVTGQEFEALIKRAFHEVDESLYDAMFALLELAQERRPGKRVGEVALARRLGIQGHAARNLLAQLRQAIAWATYSSSELDPIRVRGSS